MAALDKKYASAIKAGAIGVLLIVICGAFAYYMYERDQYNFRHSDASRYTDNFCVGVLWIPFFLAAVVIIAVFSGALSVRMAGTAIASPKDALLVAGLTGLVIWCMNMAIVASLTIGEICRAVTQDGMLGISSLLNAIPWVTGYYLVQEVLSIMGGIGVMPRRKK